MPFNVYVCGCSVRAVDLLKELFLISKGSMYIVGYFDRVNEARISFTTKLKEANEDMYQQTSMGYGDTLLDVENIRKSRADLVIVSSINACHAEDVIAALQSGANVFCEKPLCTTIDEAIAIQNAALIARKQIFSGFVLRHAPIWKKVKEILTSKEYDTGSVLNITLNETLWKGHGVLARDGWRGKKSQSGGHWVEKLCHPIDLCDWFVEDTPVSCIAMESTVYWRPEKEHLDQRAISEQNNENLLRSYNRGSMNRNISRSKDYDVGDSFSGTIKYAHGQLVTITSNTYSVSGKRMMSIECENHRTIHVEAENHKTQKIIIETRGFERGQSTDISQSITIEMPVAGCHGNGDRYIMEDLYNKCENIKDRFDCFDCENCENSDKHKPAGFPNNILNACAEKTMEFIRSTVLAICLEKASFGNFMGHSEFVKIWRSIGFPTRVENYGYSHKDEKTHETKYLDCISQLSYINPEEQTPHTDKLPCTAAFIIPYDGKHFYLMNHSMRGVDIPGGRIEKDYYETSKECAVRELWEETGIVLYTKKSEDIKLCGVKTMEALHELDKRFKYPANTKNMFYYIRIPEMSEEDYKSLKPKKGDASIKCCRYSYNDLLNILCFKTHLKFFNYILESSEKADADAKIDADTKIDTDTKIGTDANTNVDFVVLSNTNASPVIW